MKKKKQILIVCNDTSQVKKMFELVSKIEEKQIVKQTYSNSGSKGKVETKDCVINVQIFDRDGLRGVRYDHITNLTNIHDGFLESMLNTK